MTGRKYGVQKLRQRRAEKRAATNKPAEQKPLSVEDQQQAAIGKLLSRGPKQRKEIEKATRAPVNWSKDWVKDTLAEMRKAGKVDYSRKGGWCLL